MNSITTPSKSEMWNIAFACNYTKCKTVYTRSKKYQCLTSIEENFTGTSLKGQHVNELRKQKAAGGVIRIVRNLGFCLNTNLMTIYISDYRKNTKINTSSFKKKKPTLQASQKE